MKARGLLLGLLLSPCESHLLILVAPTDSFGILTDGLTLGLAVLLAAFPSLLPPGRPLAGEAFRRPLGSVSAGSAEAAGGRVPGGSSRRTGARP